MDTDLSYATRLYYFVQGSQFLFNFAYLLFTWLAFNFQNLYFDTQTSGLWAGGFPWTYLRLFGTIWAIWGIIGLVWLFNHTFRGWRYWVAAAASGGGGIWLLVCAITYISDFTDCNGTTWCVGNGNPGTIDPDWIVHVVIVCVLCVILLLGIALIMYLRFRTEFGGYVALAASPGANPNVMSVAPPGTVGFSPYGASPQMQNIYGDINAAEMGTSAFDGGGAAAPPVASDGGVPPSRRVMSIMRAGVPLGALVAGRTASEKSV
jgi:hypothetical protein